MKTIWTRFCQLWRGDGSGADAIAKGRDGGNSSNSRGDKPTDGGSDGVSKRDDPLQLRATDAEIEKNEARLRYLDYQVQILEGRVFNDHQSRRDG